MRLERGSLSFYTALLVASLTTAITIRYATFVPWGTDAAGYVGAARRWAEGRVFSPAPLQLWAPWSDMGPLTLAAPLAYTKGPERGTDVSQYPLGFPVVLAAADTIDREFGVYLVPPLFAGLLVWCGFLLGRRLAGPWAGVLSACLIAATPITLDYAVTPMSDVPSAALLLLSIEMSLRPSRMSAAASGCAVAAAIMMRPILVPLGAIPFLLAIVSRASHAGRWREWNWQRALLFSVCAAIGPALVAWSQRELYGGAFTPGYPGAEAFFSRKHIVPNLKIYPQNLMALHSPVVFAGLIWALALLVMRRLAGEAARVATALVALALGNYVLYLPYLHYTDSAYLRFLLPAMAAMFVLLASASAWLVPAAGRWRWIAVPLAIVPALVVAAGGYEDTAFVFGQRDRQRQAQLMGRYLREVLPPRAAVLTFLHGGAVLHYTGRQIIRWDLMQGEQLQMVVETLERRGHHPVIVIDQQVESLLFKTTFAGTPYERLGWRPRAQFKGGTTLWYLDFADRDGSRDRARAPIDVLD